MQLYRGTNKASTNSQSYIDITDSRDVVWRPQGRENSNGEAVDAAHLCLLLAVLGEGDDELQRGLPLRQARGGLDQHHLRGHISIFSARNSVSH